MKFITGALLFLLSIPAFAEKPITFQLIEEGPLYGINNLGDVVGGNFIRKANGTFITLDAPGATSNTAAIGIDDEGRVVGSYSHFGFDPKSFLYENGTYQILEYPGAAETYARAIDAGRVVGWFADPLVNGHAGLHGFLFANGTWTQLDYPGAGATFAYGIAPNGKIYGYWDETTFGRHGFIYSNGQYELLDFPQSGPITFQWSALHGANSNTVVGEVVLPGECYPAAFLITDKKSYLLDLPATTVWDINEAGTIVGQFGQKGFIARASAFILRK